MEDEVDLRKYIAVLIAHWKLIVIITAIAVFVAGMVSFLSPSVYEAKTSVLITKARSELVLEPMYKTSFQQDSTSMRQALLALAKSPSVATQTIKQLGSTLEPGEWSVNKILGKVQVSNEGDLVKITAKSTNPQKAAAIANAWAESYKSYVNGLYGGILQSPQGLKAQADIAAKEYKEKQEALENFIRDNRITELSQQISDKEILYDVKLLREQVKSGSPSAASSTANNLALVLLQARAFTNLTSGLQISLGSLSDSEVNLGALDALISTLEARAGGKPGRSLADLQKDILLLSAELEQEKASQRELEGARDIAWNAYTTIAGKIIETDVAIQAQTGVVEVAEIATLPDPPAVSRKMMNIGIALVLGIVVGILSAFGREYFRKTRERPTSTKAES